MFILYKPHGNPIYSLGIRDHHLAGLGMHSPVCSQPYLFTTQFCEQNKTGDSMVREVVLEMTWQQNTEQSQKQQVKTAKYHVKTVVLSSRCQESPGAQWATH